MSSKSTDSAFAVSPTVRALAHQLNVDLTIVTPSGADGSITAADVQRVHKVLTEVGPLEKLRGARRAMAQTMAQARAEAVVASVTEDACLQAWPAEADLALRLIRAIVAGVRTEGALNAWFDSEEIGRRLLGKIHLGIAVDTPDGQFVCVMQDVGNRAEDSWRKGLQKMKQDTRDHTVPAEELRGYTLTLSNHGVFGGRYATSAVVPPTVATIAAGARRDAVVAIGGQARVAPILPLSVSFDQRAVTPGEAARFLAAMVADLEKAA